MMLFKENINHKDRKSGMKEIKTLVFGVINA